VASRSTTTGPVIGTGERCPQTLARAAARAPRIAVIAATESSPRASMSRLIVGSEATVPNNSDWARTTAASARQSPPSAIATARSSTVLPGSCTDRASRHGLNARDSASVNPPTAAACSSIAAPPDEISDSRPDSIRTTPPQRLRFTYGVPFSLRIWTFDKPKFPLLTGTSVHHAPKQPRSHERSRLDLLSRTTGLGSRRQATS
jgi:hypothetical protein